MRSKSWSSGGVRVKKSVLSIEAEILGLLAFAAAMTLMRIPSKFPLTFTVNKNLD